jgi:hypothetical protein
MSYTEKILHVYGLFQNEGYSGLQIAIYVLCLDAKKVTKKNQGQPETLRAFFRHTPHIALRKMNL